MVEAKYFKDDDAFVCKIGEFDYNDKNTQICNCNSFKLSMLDLEACVRLSIYLATLRPGTR